MLSYILTAAGSLAAGVGLTLTYQWSVRRAVGRERAAHLRAEDKLRAENRRLREDIQAYELSSEAARAREQGKVVGLREARNMSQAERLVRSMQGNGGRREVQIGGGGQ